LCIYGFVYASRDSLTSSRLVSEQPHYKDFHLGAISYLTSPVVTCLSILSNLQEISTYRVTKINLPSSLSLRVTPISTTPPFPLPPSSSTCIVAPHLTSPSSDMPTPSAVLAFTANTPERTPLLGPTSSHPSSQQRYDQDRSMTQEDESRSGKDRTIGCLRNGDREERGNEGDEEGEDKSKEGEKIGKKFKEIWVLCLGLWVCRGVSSQYESICLTSFSSGRSDCCRLRTSFSLSSPPPLSSSLDWPFNTQPFACNSDPNPRLDHLLHFVLHPRP
jgi:hypothetical protein